MCLGDLRFGGGTIGGVVGGIPRDRGDLFAIVSFFTALLGPMLNRFRKSPRGPRVARCDETRRVVSLILVTTARLAHDALDESCGCTDCERVGCSHINGLVEQCMVDPIGGWGADGVFARMSGGVHFEHESGICTPNEQGMGIARRLRSGNADYAHICPFFY